MLLLVPRPELGRMYGVVGEAAGITTTCWPALKPVPVPRQGQDEEIAGRIKRQTGRLIDDKRPRGHRLGGSPSGGRDVYTRCFVKLPLSAM